MPHGGWLIDRLRVVVAAGQRSEEEQGRKRNAHGFPNGHGHDE
jgi:hypothetical protein